MDSYNLLKIFDDSTQIKMDKSYVKVGVMLLSWQTANDEENRILASTTSKLIWFAIKLVCDYFIFLSNCFSLEKY